MKLLIVQFFPSSAHHLSLLRVHILITVFPSLPQYVHVVATSMVFDEMDGACSTNGISKKCLKKFCSENRKRVVYIEDQVQMGECRNEIGSNLVCDWIELAEDRSLRSVDSYAQVETVQRRRRCECFRF